MTPDTAALHCVPARGPGTVHTRVQGIEGVGHEGDPNRSSDGGELVGTPELNTQLRALRMGGTSIAGVENLENWAPHEP